MGRPKGLKRIDGVWYTVEQQISMGLTPVISNEYVTPPPMKITPSVASAADTLETPVSVPVAPVKVQGVKMYTPDEIQKIEAATGLVFQGWMADGSSAALVPVFVRADHPEEKKIAILAEMRKGA